MLVLWGVRGVCHESDGLALGMPFPAEAAELALRTP